MSGSVRAVALKRYRFPQIAIGRFFAWRTMRSAIFWALVFGAFVASKSAGYAKAYPSLHDRTALAASFSNNIGLNAIFGTPHSITTVAGFTVWNTLNAMGIIGVVWALLISTRSFRGEEEAGRWEILLAGPTSARGAAINAIAGLGAALLTLYLVTAAGFVLVGKVHGVDFSVSAALFFALAAVAGAAEFMVVGGLASQLMPTRARAASFTAVCFGICFLIRAMGDITGAHWLLNVSPLGWIERLQPLYGSQPIWLLPIGAWILGLIVLTVWLAGRRDLGDSFFATHDTAKPRAALLGSPLAIAVRLTRTTSIGWILAVGFMGLFFGVLTKSAAQAFTSSPTAEHVISHLAANDQTNLTALAAKTFLGVVFLLIMLLIMAYVASALGALREDEAQGYLDNLLVGPVGRLRWLYGRIALIAGVTGLIGLVAGIAVWFGESSQGGGIDFMTVLLAGCNAIAPALFTLGLGVLAFGFMPRLTTIVVYGTLAWSFLLQMLDSGINLNHWILDTSILHHIALAPATDPNWRLVITLGLIGLALSLIGSWRFVNRDLQSE